MAHDRVQLVSDAMCLILSFIHLKDRVKLLTTCKAWHRDIREMCRRQTVIAFRKPNSCDDYQSYKCLIKSHSVPKSEELTVKDYEKIASSDVTRHAFLQLFPNLKVIGAPAVVMSRDFIDAFHKTLQCLEVEAVCRSAASCEETFDQLTCADVHDLKNLRISADKFPQLVSLSVLLKMDPFIHLLPAKLKRLDCVLVDLMRLAGAPFASSLTHLRLDLSLVKEQQMIGELEQWIFREANKIQLFFPNLKSLVLDGKWNDSAIGGSYADVLNVPNLKSLALTVSRAAVANLTKFFQKLPKLHALAFYTASDVNKRQLLDVILKTQPDIQILFWPNCLIDQRSLDQLMKFESLQVFGGFESRLYPSSAQKKITFSRSIFAERLKTIYCFCIYDWKSPAARIVSEVSRLKQLNVHHMFFRVGEEWNVFIQACDRLTVQ